MSFKEVKEVKEVNKYASREPNVADDEVEN